jgi:hypothetical protein
MQHASAFPENAARSGFAPHTTVPARSILLEERIEVARRVEAPAVDILLFLL